MASDSDPDIDLIMGDMDGELDPSILSFQASAIIAVCATVIIGNAFVCALNCFKQNNGGLHLKFILLATIMNFISAIICMPLMAASLLEGEWKYGYSLCKITGLLCFVSMVATMSLTALASISKIFHYMQENISKLHCDVLMQRDFIVMMIVFLFTIISQLILFVLVYTSNLWKAPFPGLCKYANSPNLTGYRMFYLVYSILLTLAALILVIPNDTVHDKG
eukprot:Seg348.3 transcript_id=Seg348.3/GoldUCD/mRNA.D3Y31 product="hypothetical protein" protein_id=Seg348.3/GoldUCD/D3Y31